MSRLVQIVEAEDLVTCEAPPLLIAFRWDGARWSHDIRIERWTAAASVEWKPDEDDPSRVVSPAYQQLSTQHASAGARVLLVGQWGPHHFSAVFSIEASDAAVEIHADVAALSRSTLDVLAGTYLVDLTSSDLLDAHPGGLAWASPSRFAGRLEFEAVEGSSQVGLAEAGRRATRVQASRLDLSSKGAQRLQYRWRWRRDHPFLPSVSGTNDEHPERS